ncbi:MAG: hypothetical protein FJW35_05635 [Acidobacteria bacterium]|nr:hypothetical protein [Acidobacteriota bacterium]
MRNSLLLHVVWVFLLAVVFSACASYPEEQLKQAQAAMDEAKELRTEVFAAADWEDAVKMWDEAQGHLKQEKFALAAPALLRAKNRFEKARGIAQAKRKSVLEEITNQQHTLNVRYATLKNDLAASRVSRSVRKGIEEACLDMDKQVESLAEQIEQGDLLQAQGTVQKALRELYQLELKFQEATRRR